MPQSTVTTTSGFERGLQAGDGRFRDAVALIVAMRDERLGVRAQRAQTARERGGCGYAVQVEVAEDGDALACADGLFQSVNGIFQARDDIRIQPVTVQIGMHEQLGFLGRVDAARHQRGRHEMRQIQFLLQPGNGGSIRWKDVEVC